MTSDAVLLVGSGRMGSAMLRGWLSAGSFRVIVVEPVPALGDLAHDPRVTVLSDAAQLLPSFAPAAMVLAVKPQVMPEILPAYRRFVSPRTCAISIAAGRSLAALSAALGDGPIVRAMPNLPAAIGRGITVAVANQAVSDAQRGLAGDLLAACGSVVWVADEALIDPVTAVSGSGPAYVFLLIEVMAAAGTKAGLPPDLAMQLARETVAGAGELVRQSPETAAALRESVSSPGGTTLAALSVLTESGRLQHAFDEAIAAAAARARVLGS